MNIIHDLIKVQAAYTEVAVGDPKTNVERMIQTIKASDADIIVFPELSVTGYTCGDLFGQSVLLQAAFEAVAKMAQWANDKMVVVGLPVVFQGTLYNCAAVLNRGYVLGIVPKQYLPNYKEFYEARWFQPAVNVSGTIVSPSVTMQLAEGVSFIPGEIPQIPFGTDLIFNLVPRNRSKGYKVGIEICEDLWTPIPPSSFLALAGADILLNLSASNETVAKSEYRRNLVTNQSGRCIAAYVYCSAGPTESTSDLVFGGHCIIAENGNLVVETEKFKRVDSIEAIIDVEKLRNERRKIGTFNDAKRLNEGRNYREVNCFIATDTKVELRTNPHPFVPSDPLQLKERTKEVFNIQTAALEKRLERMNPKSKVVFGCSGGLDSTAAAMVIDKIWSRQGWDRKRVVALMMPGFGTSKKTYDNSDKLIDLLGFTKQVIPINEIAFDSFKLLGHSPFEFKLTDIDSPKIVCWKPDEEISTLDQFEAALKTIPAEAKDLVFENVQARLRTFFLMSKGFVVGTGDLSELALGWCTFNGDHMSMYNPNCSIPKTLVRFLVEYVAKYESQDIALSDVLMSIADTTVSPELLPLNDKGEIQQSTEASVGPYELQDYFLSMFIRNGFRPSKIALLAEVAFNGKYNRETIKHWMEVFLRKFFTNQFKRNCVPDGPKVGSVSLSPRGDWRMPSDGEVNAWIADLEKI